MASGDRLFGDMSLSEHAYALGVVAALGRVKDGALAVELRGDGQPLLSMLGAKSASDIPTLYRVDGDAVWIEAPLAALATSYLGAPPGSADCRFPELPPRLAGAFLRGLFDSTGSINSPKNDELELRWKRPAARLLDRLLEWAGAPPSKAKKQSLVWRGAAALDLLGQLYGEFEPPRKQPPVVRQPGLGAAPQDPMAPRPFRAPIAEGSTLYRAKHLERFWAWSARVAHFKSDGVLAPRIVVQLVHAEAVLPRKERVSDSGYDLTLLYQKSRQGNVVLYGTGVIVEPPFGWYFDVVARSSIVKRGYMLANNVGIIDRAYRGEIFVPLYKTDPGARELELPARVAQLIPRPIVHFPVVLSSALSSTQRGSGGFGSTG